jgi:CTP:molybdopterin cytidylyltransferase MocA
MLGLEGDEGARRLLGMHPEEVCEVPIASEAIFGDFDTPEAFPVAPSPVRL